MYVSQNSLTNVTVYDSLVSSQVEGCNACHAAMRLHASHVGRRNCRSNTAYVKSQKRFAVSDTWSR